MLFRMLFFAVLIVAKVEAQPLYFTFGDSVKSVTCSAISPGIVVGQIYQGQNKDVLEGSNLLTSSDRSENRPWLYSRLFQTEE